jgi:hypothetical protein
MTFQELIEMQICFSISLFAFYSRLTNNWNNFGIACLLAIISNIIIYNVERHKK